MSNFVSVILSYRNRPVEFVRSAINSLDLQTFKDFEVIFIDYGSEPQFSEPVKKFLKTFPFVKYTYVPVSGQLWSRGKAINLGFRLAKYATLFVSDIDIYLSPNTLENAVKSFNPNFFSIFDWIFLPKNESQLLLENSGNFSFKKGIISDDNGMIMISKAVLEKTHGFDEFFHLYGGEDSDFKNRLEMAGFIKQKQFLEPKIYHLWHPHVIVNRGSKLLPFPFVPNIKRINEKHVFHNLQRGNPMWENSQIWGLIPNCDFSKEADLTFNFENIQSRIIHFFEVVLPQYSGQTVQINIKQTEDFNSLKSKLNRKIFKNTESFILMQEVNELISSKLVFCYRNRPYEYLIDDKSVNISLKLKV